MKGKQAGVAGSTGVVSGVYRADGVVKRCGKMQVSTRSCAGYRLLGFEQPKVDVGSTVEAPGHQHCSADFLPPMWS